MENIEKKQSKFSKLLHYFTTYEWIWLLSLSFFSVLFLFLFPEEETNGISGIIMGAFIIFFAYIGFDAVSTAAEETKNPQKDLPLAILGTLIFCTILYVLV